LTRTDLAEKIRAIKRRTGRSWRDIAGEIGAGSPIPIVAALLGQMRLTPAEADNAARVFGLTGDERDLLTEIPYRGSLPPGPPTDPLVYRFHELVNVYGTTWKALIEEEFGDGIMSAIDFEMSMKREPDPNGDRVRIVLSGKFLPYRRF